MKGLNLWNPLRKSILLGCIFRYWPLKSVEIMHKNVPAVYRVWTELVFYCFQCWSLYQMAFPTKIILWVWKIYVVKLTVNCCADIVCWFLYTVTICSCSFKMSGCIPMFLGTNYWEAYILRAYVKAYNSPLRNQFFIGWFNSYSSFKFKFTSYRLNFGPFFN